MSFNEFLSLPHGEIGLFTSGPKSSDVPAVIVLQEIFGVNDNIRSTVEHLAGEGFYSVAPDLFWRSAPGIDLNPDDPESRDKAMQLSQGYDAGSGLEDIRALVAQLRKTHSKIGLIGYCLGGRMAFLSWLNLELDAVVSYYGVNLVPLLADCKNQNRPFMVHLGKEDHLNPPEAQAAILEALGSKANVSLNIYPEVGHAFARRNASSYVAKAAVQADTATLKFLRENLM
ncbi:dienelactone hydrolase family protein [Pseudomonas guariconensis]|uniref:dienelactone hydrolase family protein n=1 Tax=Pseudomonas guariconensis TaxID=1288410 RepID=UPI0018AAC100|nr:dienelactone hydrolase family protein [Pseudomonas guariconensis]MBF8721774.1 dienelactone hydrolase family protein [Pseudomonas guariconensis]